MGKNLPCVDAVEERGELIYNQTSIATSEAYNDRIVFPIGSTCPLERSETEVKDNQFKAMLVYELPVTTTATSGTVKVNGGIYSGTDPEFWLSSNDLTLSSSAYTGTVRSVSGKVFFYLVQLIQTTNMKANFYNEFFVIYFLNILTR